MSKKLTIEEMKNFAKERFGKCLSTEYINNRTKLEWECSKGHKFWSQPSEVKSGSWCPYCANNRKQTIEDMKRLAELKGGKCLSTEYINANTRLLWECSEGHQWQAKPGNVKHGTWCKICADRNSKNSRKDSIENMKKLAESRKGKCLSEEYIGANEKLLWECEKGHQWLAVPYSIKNGTWCSICSRKKGRGKRKLTIEEMQELAKFKKGKCLSKEYINANTKLVWKCEKGHQWSAVPSSIKNGTWCPHCLGKHKTIIDMQEMAAKKGGKCLSKKYINNNTKLQWECSQGHKWWSVPSSIQQGGWCPHCTFHIHEEKIRFVLQEIFNNLFPKNRTVLGGRLELDGYNEKLKLAFEFNGKQHYIQNDGFHRNKKDFEHQLNRDKRKKEMCKEKEITLLIVPYNFGKTDEDLISFIFNKLTELKITFKKKTIVFDNFYKDFSPFQELKKIAKEKGGDLVSTFYINSNTKLEWQCSEGHKWFSVPNSIKQGTWCPTCSIVKRAESRKDNIENMKKIAEKKGGFCLSEKYESSQTKLEWQCSDGHRWFAVPNSVKQGHWCPTCSTLKTPRTNKSSIEEMKNIAKERGGECLSIDYKNAHSNLTWQCSEGHIWESPANRIKSGKWCPKCGILKRSESKRDTIENMKKIAQSRNGDCISEKYINNNTKLRWKCSEEHVWETTPLNIKSGTWCPICESPKRAKRQSTIIDW